MRFAIPLLITAGLFAQTEKGQLTGTVLDGTGSLLAAAEVLVINAATGTRRSTQSTGEGFYAVPSLDPGEYSIEVKRSGFRTSRRSGILLRVNERININFTLELGAVTDSIEVTGTVAALDTTTSDLGHVVERRQIVDLPLNGRNTIALAALAPGVRPQGTFARNPASVNYIGWGNFSANGGMANANEVLVDGIPVTHSEMGGVVYTPPVDGTQEFKVQTNNSSAEFDRTAGGVINISLRSGTNQLHGSAYEFLRNNVFDANNFYLNRAGTARPPLRYNQFGATVGGPVIRDKTFFFGLYEGFRQRQAPTLNGTVPTPLQQAGDFSNTRTAAGALIGITDPLTNRLGADGRTTRTPFPNNVLPSSRIDPVSQKLARYIWPNPNNPGAPFTNLNNYIVTAPNPISQDQFTIKMDHQVSAANRLSGSYSSSWFSLGGWDPLFNRTSVSQEYFAEKNRSHLVSIGDTHVLTPTTILELRAGFLRFSEIRLPKSFGEDLGAFGLPASYQNVVQYRHIPVVTATGLIGLTNTAGSTIFRATNNYSLSGSVTKIRGLHNLKAGAQYRALQLNDVQLPFPSGSFAFTPGFTQEDPLRPAANSGVGFASMLLGYPASGSVPKVSPLSTQIRYLGYYIQDDWRVTKRLTLNLGLRHSIEPFLTERFNRLSSFDAGVVPQEAARFTKLNLKGGLAFVTPERRSPADTSARQWAPRFGFAFQILPRTVLRGGYGLFWLPNNLATTNSGTNNPAFATSTALVSSVDGGITPLTRMSNPFPDGLLSPPGSAAGADTLIGQAVSGWLRETRPGNTQQWNLSIQQDLSRGLTFETAYSASKGTHLPTNPQFDQLPNHLLSLGQGLLQQVPNPFFGLVSTGALSTRTVSAGQLLRPFPQFNGVTGNAPLGNLTYHSFQAKVSQRFAQGAMVTLAYTFAKNLGDVAGPQSGFMDNNNRRLDKSYVSFDLPHRAVVHFNYELPFGKWGKLRGKWNGLVAGWQVNGLATMQSGFPLIFGTAQNVTNSFGGGSRPNQVGNPVVPGSAHERLNKWFDPAAFAQPAPFTFGSVPATFGLVRSHGVANLDFSLFKNVRFLERYTLQVRAESFNMMNRVQFGVPSSTVGAPGFGTVTTQGNDPRQIQLALKLLF